VGQLQCGVMDVEHPKIKRISPLNYRGAKRLLEFAHSNQMIRYKQCIWQAHNNYAVQLLNYDVLMKEIRIVKDIGVVLD
jgi:hypothetical protein